MRDAASESPDRSKLSTAATIASDFLASALLAASAASPNFVLKASTRALVVPLVANIEAKSLEVKLDVSVSKIPRMFSCRKSLLISEFEAFSAWPTFELNRRVQCLMVSP